MREKINHKIDFCTCAGVCGSVCVEEYSETPKPSPKYLLPVWRRDREKEIEK